MTMLKPVFQRLHNAIFRDQKTGQASRRLEFDAVDDGDGIVAFRLNQMGMHERLQRSLKLFFRETERLIELNDFV